MTTHKALDLLSQIRQKFPDKPIGVLVYLNLILQFCPNQTDNNNQSQNISDNINQFFIHAKKSGINSVIIPEIPIEELSLVHNTAKQHQIDLIFLASTNTPEERLKLLIEYSTSFLYLISTPSITGARKSKTPSETIELMHRLQQEYNIPIVIGFGVSSPEQIKYLAQQKTDGIIIASQLIQFRNNPEELESYCQQCLQACQR